MTVLAYLTDPSVVAKILLHLGLPHSPPPLSPARLDAQVELFDDDLPVDLALPRVRGGRAPPRGHDDRRDADATFDANFDWGA
jgi:hypothetical protein